MKIGFRILAKGLVQGVGFRYFTRQKALSFNLTGDVKNMDDGRVLINVFGDEPVLKSFLDWCHNGPESAEVESLEYTAQAFQEMASFEILR